MQSKKRLQNQQGQSWWRRLLKYERLPRTKRHIVVDMLLAILLVAGVVIFANDIMRHRGVVDAMEPLLQSLRAEGYKVELTRSCHRPAYKVGTGPLTCHYSTGGGSGGKQTDLAPEEAEQLAQRFRAMVDNHEDLRVKEDTQINTNPYMSREGGSFWYNLRFEYVPHKRSCSFSLVGTSPGEPIRLLLSCQDTSWYEKVFRSEF